MEKSLLNFFDSHIGTLAGWDLVTIVVGVVVIFAIIKFTPILQEHFKNKKQVVERRKGMNGDLEKTLKEHLDKVIEKEREGFEEYKDFADKRFNEERKQNASEHNDLYNKVDCVEKTINKVDKAVARIEGYMEAEKNKNVK